MSVFPRFFWFYRVFGCFSAMGVQKHHKKRFAKKSCRKVFTKSSTKNPKPTFLGLFYHVFGRFSVRGAQNTTQIYRKNKSDPIPFSYSDPPTHHGGHRFFFAGPLAAGSWCTSASRPDLQFFDQMGCASVLNPLNCIALLINYINCVLRLEQRNAPPEIKYL